MSNELPVAVFFLQAGENIAGEQPLRLALRLARQAAHLFGVLGQELPHALDGAAFPVAQGLVGVGLVDGRFGLNRSGPLRGDPVRLDWLLASQDLYATDWAACNEASGS